MTLQDFSIQLGNDILGSRGDGSPLGAFLEEAEKFDWDIFPTIDARALPGPSPDPEVLELFFREFESRVAQDAGEIDAVFLVLHGAMAIENIADVEGDFLSRIRRNPKLAWVPIFGVLDLHANFTQAMAENSNALLVYRQNPHIDAAETARRAAGLLAKSLKSRLLLRTSFVPTNIVWPATGTGTGDRPMKTLEALARSEERAGIEEINVFAGFAQADTPDTGVSFSIVYDPRRVSSDELHRLAKLFRHVAGEEKTYGLPGEWDVDQAIDDALARGLFPACLVEPADNIGGGAPGDGTTILRALLAYQVAGAGVAINDPEAVQLLQDKELGDIVEMTIGGRSFPLDPGPVCVTARLVRKTDGEFVLEDRQSHLASMVGVNIRMGPCAVVEAKGVTILLTSQRTAPMDLGQWRSQGVAPESLSLIGVKAAVAHRRAYDPIVRASYTVRTPGPCTSDLRSLPYRKIRRPVFPLDS